MSTATFKVHKKELLAVLKRLKAMEKAARRKGSTLEVTIINFGLQLIIPGIEVPIAATTTGTAKFTIPLLYFADIVDTEKNEVLNFTLKEDRLNLRDFSWHVQATFFENNRILRSINLPVNYKYLDIVRLYLSEKYTAEEIEFNNLEKDVMKAIDKLKINIDKATTILKKYGFSKDEVEQILTKKIKTE